MEKKEYVTYGCKRGCPCAGDHAITGCRFTLSPMSDRFIEIILGAVGKTDTSKVWSRTDEVSTIYRGKRVHVLDALKACFTGAFTEGVHMALAATVSKGCPGDVEADSFMAEDDEPVNEKTAGQVHFPVICKFSMYPMGVENYMEYIAHVVNHAIDLGVYDHSTHYVTILKGDVQDIFRFFEEACAWSEKELSHYVMEITMAVNLPE